MATLTKCSLSLPRLEKVLESTYHGLIKENETFVELMPKLRVDEGKVCGFHIRNTHKGDIPFQVRRYTYSNCNLLYDGLFLFMASVVVVTQQRLPLVVYRCRSCGEQNRRPD